MRETNAPDIVKFWRTHVNNNVSIGRDSSLIKRKLEELTPIQILYGMIQYVGQKTVSIPMFIREEGDWINDDEFECELEVARFITKHTPDAYYIYRDMRLEIGFFEREHLYKAVDELKEWLDKVLV